MRWLKFLLWGLLTFLTILAILGIGVVIYFESQLPNVNELKDVHLQVPLRIFAKDGSLIAEYGEKRREPVSLQQIPASLVNATLATEDQRYFSHSGIDILGLGRAAVVLILTGRKAQGGSTITMQVARNYFLTRKKTYTRKIKEILLALKIDHMLSKNKVLELYFNKIFYGNHAYGVAAAAQVYYGEPLAKLTLPQAAMIAGLPKAPSAINPIANPTAARKRRDHVLFRMYDEKFIDQATYEAARQSPITAKYHGLKIALKAPYVAEMVRGEMKAEYGKQAYTKGLNVYTTISPRLQKDANRAVFKGVLAYDKRHGYRGAESRLGQTVPQDLSLWQKALTAIPNVNNLQPAVVLQINNQDRTVLALLKNGNEITLNWQGMKWARRQFFKGTKEFLDVRPKSPSDILKVGDVIRTNLERKQWVLSQVPQVESALVVTKPATGSIQALVGGFHYRGSQFNRAIQAYRQPGSSFKPFIYSAALAKGLTLASIVNDAPIVLPSDNENDLWRPENDTKKFYGPTSLLQGLIQSRNLVSIRLLQIIGIPYALDYATRFGFRPDQMPHGLSLALGTAEVTPLQMTSGYTVFANGGHHIVSHLINHITDSTGQVIFKTATPNVCEPTPQTASTTTPQRACAEQVITPQNAYLITRALKDVILYGTGRPALALHREDLAGKTGTTNDKKDAWFCGYNHQLVATAWIGFDQPRSLFEYGNQAALPIWIDFMHTALKGQPLSNVPQPPGIITVRINPKTGQPAAPGARHAIFEAFRREHAPVNTRASENNDVGSGTLEQELY
jgi:penicillin-binding protein 1A